MADAPTLETVIDLATLARIAVEYEAQFKAPVAPLLVGGRALDTDAKPAIQAVVNLSPDSTYRTSIAPDAASAVRKARIAFAEGADFIDLGAESSNERAARVGPEQQVEQLRPVVEQLAAEGIPVSVESYYPAVVGALLEAGAAIVNLTGSADDDEVFRMAADAGATVLLCYVPQRNVREDASLPVGETGLRQVVESLRPRLDRALSAGVPSIAVDPGLGFSYANLRDARARIAVQSRYLLLSAALRELGHPVLQSLPNAFAVFQEHFRAAEGYFAVLALLGGAGVLRVHEVGHVRAVAEAMALGLEVR